ncbi:hypothetical protein [Microcella alkalica]|uniref:Antitoxin n=1 Tax=Microcella alkalica TaxID=355930 RepID=A0A839EFT2_9MICO|nr:hypothetical protein [Microcella alkalica]MBA8848458.1 hypothetical protein [Microcella alkalica]
MVALQIRDVPDSVRDLLAEEARRRGTSLQGYLLEVLEREAADASNRRWLAAMRRRADRGRSAIDADAIVAAIADARRERAE